MTTLPGALAPKRSMPTMRPRVPTKVRQPKVTPASIDTCRSHAARLVDELRAGFTVRLLGSRHLGNALANQGVCQDEAWLAALRSPSAGQHVVDLHEIVSLVEVQNFVAVGFEALGSVFTLRLDGHRVQRDVVGVVDQDQVVELEVPGHRGSLGGDAFLHATVAGQGPDGVLEDGVLEDGVLRGVKARHQYLGRHRLPDGIANPLTERASGGYGGVYGPLALVPMMLLWIYISWWLVLLGAEIAHSIQNLGLLEAEERRRSEDEPINGLVAAQLLALVAANFESGGHGIDRATLSRV
jgi:hypothetical protein